VPGWSDRRTLGIKFAIVAFHWRTKPGPRSQRHYRQ
jgi:hypothetical protein